MKATAKKSTAAKAKTNVKPKAKLKAKAKTKLKAKPKAKITRADKIRAVLAGSKKPQTIREICAALNLKTEKARFISSYLIGRERRKEVKRHAKDCSITGRHVVAYRAA